MAGIVFFFMFHFVYSIEKLYIRRDPAFVFPVSSIIHYMRQKVLCYMYM